MKNLYFLLIPFISFSQVGINTTTPQATLHVGGATSEIKVEGLSAAYNPNNLGTESTTRVYANADGDLVLGTAQDNIHFIMDSEDYVPNNREQKVVQTGTGENFTKIAPSDYTFPSFTMEKDGVIEVHYSLSWYIRRNSSSKITDSGARTIKTTVFIFDHSTGTYLPTTYALTGQFYSNSDGLRGADGYFFNSGSDYISLPAGTYTIIFGGLVGADGNSNVFAFFGGNKDQLQVIAYYNN